MKYFLHLNFVYLCTFSFFFLGGGRKFNEYSIISARSWSFARGFPVARSYTGTNDNHGSVFRDETDVPCLSFRLFFTPSVKLICSPQTLPAVHCRSPAFVMPQFFSGIFILIILSRFFGVNFQSELRPYHRRSLRSYLETGTGN